MSPAPEDLRLQGRLRLVADLCEELRAGGDPWPRVLKHWESLGADPEEQAFVRRIYQTLQPEREPQWA